jgi:flavin reductase (DIM6/NTAB) family NADH-FMN oxidoreductase RutF
MLLSLSIGTRNGVAKDSLQNIRDRGVFCINVVSEPQLEAMNITAGDFPPDVNEFARAGLTLSEAQTVRAPYVEDCPAVFECRLFREIDLAPGVSLVIAEALGIRLDESLGTTSDSRSVPSEKLRPVGRLAGSEYALLGEVRVIERPS